jgi:putative transposase
MALGPGVPDPPAGAVLRANEKSRHHLGARAVVCARSVLGGLHHEYSLAPALA